MELHGVTGKPYSHPEVRKKLPAPFTRDRIDLDGGRRVKRAWQDISVTDVKKNDTVAGFGTVESAVEFINIETEWVRDEDGDNGGDDLLEDVSVWRVRLYNVMGDYRDYRGEQRVYAFAAAPVS